MKILITGASGFLGSAIVGNLNQSHVVLTLGMRKTNDISCDLSKDVPSLPKVDMVVHAAGKAHSLPKNNDEASEFFQVNTVGTQHLIEALNRNLPKTLVFISTVAVYGKDEGVEIDESYALLGSTPYAKSKIQAEQILLEWGRLKGVSVVILRLPLISGTNPPGNLASMAKAIRRGYYFSIGKAEARKSMVSTFDVSMLIPSLLGKSGSFNLTDGLHPQVREIENSIAKPMNRTIKSIPVWPLKMAAKIGDIVPALPLNSLRLQKLSASLTFSDLLARQSLNWKPLPALNTLKFVNNNDGK